jgi:hypothetical protein
MPSGEVRMVPAAPTATNSGDTGRGCRGDQFVATPFKVFVVPEDNDVHVVYVVPVDEVKGEVTTVPVSPTAMNCAPRAVTLFRVVVVPEFSRFHLAPLNEVSTVPLSPTAANSVPDQATLLMVSVVAEDVAAQVTPSTEELMVPFKPTATIRDGVVVPFEATSQRKLVVFDMRCVHVMPSGEVRTMPFCPTAVKSNFLGDHVIRSRYKVVPESALVQCCAVGSIGETVA